MRIFVYEYLSAAGGGAASLGQEGWAMLSSLVEDFSRLAEVETVTLLDHRAPRDLGHDCRRIASGAEPSAFRKRARRADFTLVVAPEFDDLLAKRSEWALEEGSRLLGSSPEGIRLVSDKAKLGETLRARGIRTPSIVAVLSGHQRPPTVETYPVLCKPRFGAGCRGVRWIDDADSLAGQLDQAREEAPGTDLLLQTPVPGRAASVAFLIGSKRAVPLRAGYQDVRREDGGFSYRGGAMPLPVDLEDRAVRLSERALKSFAGLKGYVGVDVILGEAADGSADHVIEINPRPTTAYVGMRRLCLGNVAETWWRMMQRDPVAALAWRSGSVRFAADGMIMV